jgi:hypothetical protein
MLGVTVEAFRAVARVHDGRSFQVFASDDERLLNALDGELIKAYDACGATS